MKYFILILSLVLSTSAHAWGKNKVPIDHDGDPSTAPVMAKMSNKALIAYYASQAKMRALDLARAEEREIREHEAATQINCIPPEIESGPAGNSAAAVMVSMSYDRCVNAMIAGGTNSIADVVRATNGNSKSSVAQMARSNNSVEKTHINAGVQRSNNRWNFATALIWPLADVYRSSRYDRGVGGQSIGDNNVFTFSNSGDQGGGVAPQPDDAGALLTGGGHQQRQISVFGNNSNGLMTSPVRSGIADSLFINDVSGTQASDTEKGAVVSDTLTGGTGAFNDDDGFNF